MATSNEPTAADVSDREALPWLTAPVAEEPARARGRAPLALAALVAAAWAGICTYAPLLALSVISALGTGAKPGPTARLAAIGWLLGNGAPVQTPTDRLTLMPLAVTAFVAWRLVRAGVHASRATGAHRARSIWPVLRAGGCVGVAYAGLGAGVAATIATPDLSVSPVRAGLTVLVLATLAATIGAVRHSRSGRLLVRRAPGLLVDAVRTGIAAAALVMAAGAACAGVALALAGGDAAQMLASFGAGATGQVGITAFCLAYLPNLAVWGAAYLLGPGFAVGVGTVVSPSDVLVGPLPGLPVLAAVPAAPLSGLAPALLGAPLLAGVCAGWLLGRRAATDRRWSGRLAAAVLASVVAGAAVQLAAVLSAGALGSGRLAQMGPHGWTVGLLASGVLCVGMVLGSAAPALTRRS